MCVFQSFSLYKLDPLTTFINFQIKLIQYDDFAKFKCLPSSSDKNTLHENLTYFSLKFLKQIRNNPVEVCSAI